MKVSHSTALRHARSVDLLAGTFGNTSSGVLNDSLKATPMAWRPAPSGQVVPFDMGITRTARELRLRRQLQRHLLLLRARAVPACEAAQPSGRPVRRPSASCALCATAAARRMAAAALCRLRQQFKRLPFGCLALSLPAAGDLLC